MDCPVCNSSILTKGNTDLYCEICKSTVIVDANQRPIKVLSGIKFKLINLIIGLVIVGSVIGISSTLFIGNLDFSAIEIGIFLLVIPLVGIIRTPSQVFDYDWILGVYMALFSGRLRYYDFGSKVLAVACLAAQVSGLALIILGLS